LLTTFYVFFDRSFQKNVKSHVFLKSEKNVKYVFSNTVLSLLPSVRQEINSRFPSVNYAAKAQCG